MVDTLKLVGKTFVVFVFLLVALATGFKIVSATGLGATSEAQAMAKMTPEEASKERDRLSQVYTRRAIADRKIPPNATMAICDARDQLIGYYFTDKGDIFDQLANPDGSKRGISLAVVYDDKKHKTQFLCW